MYIALIDAELPPFSIGKFITVLDEHRGLSDCLSTEGWRACVPTRPNHSVFSGVQGEKRGVPINEDGLTRVSGL